MLQKFWSTQVSKFSSVSEGCDVSLCSLTGKHQLHLNYAGIDYPHFVFCKRSEAKEMAAIASSFRAGTPVLVQIPCSKGTGKTLSFTTTVASDVTDDYSTVALQFPQDINEINQRENQRTSSSLTGKLYNRKNQLLGFVWVVNVSASGIRVRIERSGHSHCLSEGDAVILNTIDKTGEEYFVAGKVKCMHVTDEWVEYGVASINREATAQMSKTVVRSA